MDRRYEKGRVHSLTFSPDGKLLASGGRDNAVHLWDVSTQKQAGKLSADTGYSVHSVTFSPDGKTLASAGWNKTVCLWDVESQKQIGKLHQGHTDVRSIVFSPDGRLLASGGGWLDKMVLLWDVESQRQVGILGGHIGPVGSIAFSPDGKVLASGTGYLEKGFWAAPTMHYKSEDWGVRLWDVESQQQVGLLQGNPELSSVAFSPNGKMLASAGGFDDNTIRLWNVESQKQTGLLQGHKAWVSALVFSPDGKVLASGGWDNTIRLWDAEMQKEVGVLQRIGQVGSLAFSPDGKLLASTDGSLWNVETQQRVGSLKVQGNWGYCWCLAFSPDGKTLAIGCNEDIRLWDVESQEQIGLLQEHTGWVYSIAFSSDGKWLASGGSDGTILLWGVGSNSVSIEPKEKQLMTIGELKRTMLLQNFPNPFNPETWIPFTLSETADVEIRICSANGHLVRTLRLGQREAGIYQSKAQAAYWDGKIDAGESVSSGVYFYELRAGEETLVRKAMLIR